MRRHTANSRASTKSIHRSVRSPHRSASLLSTFAVVAGIPRQTSRSIKPRELDLRCLRLFFGPVFNEANEPSSTCRLHFRR